MLVGSLIAFAALVLCWMALPDTTKTTERTEASVSPVRSFATEA